MAYTNNINSIADFVSFVEELKKKREELMGQGKRRSVVFRETFEPMVEAAQELSKKLSWEEVNVAFAKRLDGELSPEEDEAVYMLWYAKCEQDYPEALT